jgi:hypothetical protein
MRWCDRAGPGIRAVLAPITLLGTSSARTLKKGWLDPSAALLVAAGWQSEPPCSATSARLPPIESSGGARGSCGQRPILTGVSQPR